MLERRVQRSSRCWRIRAVRRLRPFCSGRNNRVVLFGEGGGAPCAGQYRSRAHDRTGPAGSLVGKVLADRFEILSRIGEGGTGVVYKAKQLTVDRIVAIKLLGAHVSSDPSWVKRFHNEARAAARLDHPKHRAPHRLSARPKVFCSSPWSFSRALAGRGNRAAGQTAAAALRIISQVLPVCRRRTARA